MAIWLCGYVAKCPTGGTGAQVVGEPPARRTLIVRRTQSDAGVGIGMLIGDRDCLAQK